MASIETPRIYVACLAAYNNGKLHGRWIDVTTADEMDAKIKAMLAESPEPGAEEWAIHDFEGFQGIKVHEHESLHDLEEIAAALEEHGDVFGALAGYLGHPKEALEAIENGAYQGTFRALEDWAEQYWDDTGMLKEIPENARRYIDFERWARDAELSGDIFTVEGGEGVYVFHSNW